MNDNGKAREVINDGQGLETLIATAAPVQPLTIAGTSIFPGKRLKIEIPVARLPTGTTLSLPVTVIHGKEAGPCLWLSAAIHGDELNGVEIIRRLVNPLKPSQLRGTLIAVPVVNIFGLLEQSRYLPDRRDLNRAFPGSLRGSLAARLAALLMREIVGHCHLGIDLHTAAIHRINWPQIRADLDDLTTYALAKAFGAPILIHSGVRDGSLRQAAAQRGIPTLLYEAGEALRFDEMAIQRGMEGIQRVMITLKMLQLDVPNSVPVPLETRTTKWIRASRGGLWHREVHLGQRLMLRQRLGFVADAFGDHRVEIRSPVAGMVIGHSQNPLVHQGDALVHVAQLTDS
ncbi:N-alpha-acetyl-L-2,4-diaminobutyric acid deacetylase [Halomicronema hongdechloris C2206]|uniref:N-alpha-acetyl-L-2,4-diaminobutyric acid deacetylase n=1 Tax=Halomicronema hongdechloris C2206 TaxID=1641165 RepID=A0A1Z3HJQ9_9CYAN|nr:succinylglutamate desuccinylase/aspartoacylase family protein [Halomicronema hongdechloris]ASC70541.1 N-alpha-acetyl-L-2,4-diaminobutyric acid deacetylase [Halomicronema hongdechloris C2206]